MFSSLAFYRFAVKRIEPVYLAFALSSIFVSVWLMLSLSLVALVFYVFYVFYVDFYADKLLLINSVFLIACVMLTS